MKKLLYIMKPTPRQNGERGRSPLQQERGKALIICLLVMLFSISLVFAEEVFVVNSNSQTLSRIDLTSFQATNTFAQLGLYANDIALYHDKLYVVNSGDDAVQVIDSTTGSQLDNILLESSCNPYNITIHEDFAYVSCWLSGQVARVDLQNTRNIAYLPVGNGPQGMAVVGEKLYIAISGYPSYSVGLVKVVDLNAFEVLTTINVTLNPQSMIVDDLGFIHLICSGDYGYNFSQIKVIDSATDEVIESILLPSVSFFTTIQRSPGNLVFVGNFYGLGFLTYDIETFEIVNTVGNFLFPGSNKMIYDDSHLYVLVEDYFSPTTFAAYTHDFAFIQQVNVGMMAVEMVYKGAQVNDKDIVKPTAQKLITYPNPFKNEIRFKAEKASTIEIFNARGQKIRTLKGQDIVWNGTNEKNQVMPSGVYFVRATDKDNVVTTKKIMFIK